MLKHNNLMLRSERRERLEAWATHRALIVSTRPTPSADLERATPYSLGSSSTITTRVMPSAAFFADI